MKNVCITGVSSGIGKALAEEMPAGGAHLYGLGRTPTPVDTVNFHCIPCGFSEPKVISLVFSSGASVSGSKGWEPFPKLPAYESGSFVDVRNL